VRVRLAKTSLLILSYNDDDDDDDMVMFRMSKSEYQDEAVVYQLKQELHEKDLRLTDIQLEALSSAHQLEQLCETMNRMKVDELCTVWHVHIQPS